MIIALKFMKSLSGTRAAHAYLIRTRYPKTSNIPNFDMVSTRIPASVFVLIISKSGRPLTALFFRIIACVGSVCSLSVSP